jgi:hypothetical protein
MRVRQLRRSLLDTVGLVRCRQQPTMTELRAPVARSSNRLAPRPLIVKPWPVQPRTPGAAGASRALATATCASGLARGELPCNKTHVPVLPVTAFVYRRTVWVWQW